MEQVKQRYYVLVKPLRENGGGDPVALAPLAEARKAAEEALYRRPCAECDGTGKRRLGRGIKVLAFKCVPCKGTGKLYIRGL
jgi:hypothetical protein